MRKWIDWKSADRGGSAQHCAPLVSVSVIVVVIGFIESSNELRLPYNELNSKNLSVPVSEVLLAA
jgi:hypothetical protein